MASRMLAAATGGEGGTEGRDGGGRRWQRGNDFGTGHGSIGAPGQTPSSMPSAGRRGAIGAAARLVGWRMAMETKVVHRRSRRYGAWDAGVASVCYSGRVRWKGCLSWLSAGWGKLGGCCGLKCEGHAGTWGRESVVGPAQTPPQRVARLNRRESVPYAGALRCAVISSLAPAMPHYPNANVPSPALVLLQVLHCQNGHRGVP